jgi:hypothetical protein
LTLIEKRIFYYIIKEVRSKYNTGQQDLFDDLILNIRVSDLCKEVNQRQQKRNGKPWRNFALPPSPMQMKKRRLVDGGFINTLN